MADSGALPWVLIDASYRLRCPFCFGDLWTTDDGATCVVSDSAGVPGCGAEWDAVGVLRVAGANTARIVENATIAVSAELDRLRAREAALVEALAEAERRVTLGGIPPRPDQTWANLALPAPASASDDTAPPLHRKTRDEA